MRKEMKNRKPLAGGKRKQGSRIISIRFLIVCEGTETEPNYFRSFIKDQWSEVHTASSDIKGCGKGTCRLLTEAQKIRSELENRRQIKFDRVWLVFDKDEFKDFNKAILSAEKKNIGCAWSNESFELWYCLHFQNISTGLDRKSYIKAIESNIRKTSGQNNFKYDKASTNFYDLLQKYGNEDEACKRARQLREKYKKNKDFKMHNPRTEVDLLIEELKHPELL